MSEKNSSTIKLDKNSELRRSRRTKLFFVCLLLVLLILGGIVGFLRKKEFQISKITIIGTQSLDADSILKTAQDYLNGHYAIIIPKTNTLLLSKPELVRYILEQIPSIEKSTVTFKEKNSIEISVTEKKPSYVWCGTSCYFLDDTGMIYEPSPQFTQGVFITFTGGTVDENPIKSHIISEKEFSGTLKILAALDQLAIHVVGVNFENDTTVVHIDSMRGTVLGPKTQLVLTKDEASQNVFNTLSLLMNDKVFTGILATKGNLLQYIDIRFPDKIYYKFDTPAAQVTTAPVTPPAHAQLLDKTQ